jgi:ArsR family transcriptional regulator
LLEGPPLRLLHLMGDDEVCLCFFVEILGGNQPKVCGHLAYLRKASVVAPRREGNWMHYRIVEPADGDATRVLVDVRAPRATLRCKRIGRTW